MKGMPTHDGLWMDAEGDTWVVDLCDQTAIIVHDGCSWITTEIKPINELAPYAPFDPIDVPKLDDWTVGHAIRVAQDKASTDRTPIERDRTR